MRSSCVKEAVRVNGRELLADETRAHRGARRALPAGAAVGAARAWSTIPAGCTPRSGSSGLEHELVPDTNHYSILLGAPGAKRVAAAIRRAL